MTPEDLRKKAREAAREVYPPANESNSTERFVGYALRQGYVHGYLAHAAQQPNLETIASLLNVDGWTCTAHQPEPAGGCEDCTMLQMRTAKRVLRLLNGETDHDA